MILCSINEVSKSFAGTVVFDLLSLEIKQKERIGLVGRNGSGKTTIFQLISGIDAPDKGAIHIKKGTKIGYLSQIPAYPEGTTGEDVLRSAFSKTAAIQEKLTKLEQLMSVEKEAGTLQKIVEDYGILQEEFAFLGGYEMDASIQKIANGLAITPLLSKEFSLLSGGEQTKICLGFILLQNPDLLLLDEPTNHLDVFSVEWLEQYLKEYDGTVIAISHDRYFLDEVATKIIDLEDGETHVYHTNYSGYVKEKEDRLLQEFAVYQEQQKKIKKMKETIKRLKEWANQSNPPNAGLHRRAKSMEKALEKMEKLKKPVLERKTMGLQFEESDRSGKDVVTIEKLMKSFQDKTLFSNVSLAVYFQERVAIVGQNGTGKTTLLKMLLGEEVPDFGAVKLGSNVKIGYLSQHIKAGSPNQTLMDAFREHALITVEQARHILAKFLFYGPSVFKKVVNLSGGEKMRLRLAQLMHQDINFLILDEPTNHLDIESREVLEDALEDFHGTILTVSHDRYFLNKFFSKTCWIDNQKLTTYQGNYEYAKEKQKERKRREEAAAPVLKKTSYVAVKEEPVFISHLDSIECKLEKLEREIYVLEEKMAETTDLLMLQEMQNELSMKELTRVALYEQLENEL